jgi:hypothetical protein
MKRSTKQLLTLSALLIITAIAAFIFIPTDEQKGRQFVGQITPEQSEYIANSWNPPKTAECATIINAIASVVIDKSLTNPEQITSSIIKNTRLAAARLSLLTQQSKDKQIINWSYQAAGVLIKFESAFNTNSELQIKALYDQIGKLVENLPITCDNTKSERA